MKNGNWRIDKSPSVTPEGKKRQHWRVRVKAIMALGGCCVKG